MYSSERFREGIVTDYLAHKHDARYGQNGSAWKHLWQWLFEVDSPHSHDEQRCQKYNGLRIANGHELQSSEPSITEHKVESTTNP